MKTRSRVAAGALTAVILALIVRHIPLARLGSAFHDADYVVFLALMVPNAIFYFCWDTMILKIAIGWFHGDVPYRDLLPVRAASYVVGFFNTNAGRGALAGYLWYRLDVPFLELGGTVIFLVLTEYTQLVAWSLLGVFGFRTEVTTSLLPVAAAVAGFWLMFFGYTRLRITPSRAIHWLLAPREWQLLRTFRRATTAQFVSIVLLRAPMFVM